MAGSQPDMADDGYVSETLLGWNEISDTTDSESESAKAVVLDWRNNEHCGEYHTLSIRTLKAIRLFEDYRAIAMEWSHKRLDQDTFPTHKGNPITIILKAIETRLDGLNDLLGISRDIRRDPRAAQDVMARWNAIRDNLKMLKGVELRLLALKSFYDAAKIWDSAIAKPVLVLRERSWEFASRKYVVQEHHASEAYQINQANTENYWLYKSYYDVVDDRGNPALLIEEQMLDMDPNPDRFQLPEMPYQTLFRL